MGPDVIPRVTRRQAAGPLLQAAINWSAPFLERPLELLGVLALKKTSEFRLPNAIANNIGTQEALLAECGRISGIPLTD